MELYTVYMGRRKAIVMSNHVTTSSDLAISQSECQSAEDSDRHFGFVYITFQIELINNCPFAKWMPENT